MVRIEPNGAPRDQPDRLREELVLDGVQALEHGVGVGRVRDFDRPLKDDRAGIDPVVNEVDGDAEHLDAVVDRLLDGGEPGKRGQQRRVDVDDPLGEARDEVGAEQLHVAGEHDELDSPLDEPVGDRAVTRRPSAVPIVGDREHPRRDARRRGSRQGIGVRLVGGNRDDRDPVPPVDLVEQRLEVRARPGREDADVHVSAGCEARSFGKRPPLEARVPAASISSTRPSTSSARRWAKDPYSGSSS